MNAIAQPLESQPLKFGLGQPVRRVEDARFLTGRGRYVGDIDLPRQAHGAVLYSPHPHARIARIDVSAARAAPGVLCVLTGADAREDRLGEFPPLNMPEDSGGPKGFRALRPVLCAETVRCVGDRVAFVVAETLSQARDAVEQIEVDYEPLPAVVTLSGAVAPGAPRVWESCEGNVSFTLAAGNRAEADAGFARAAHVVSARLVNNRVAANALEPRACLGEYDAYDEAFTLYTSSQNPHGVRSMLTRAIFDVPETRMRVDRKSTRLNSSHT